MPIMALLDMRSTNGTVTRMMLKQICCDLVKDQFKINVEGEKHTHIIPANPSSHDRSWIVMVLRYIQNTKW